MLLQKVAPFLAVANAWLWDGGELRNDLPESAAVIEALKDSDVYEKLARDHHHHNDNEQTPVENIFHDDHDRKSATCGARPACPAFEGETRHINGRKYNLYCHNAPWGSYLWLPKSRNLQECERRCHENSYDCNGLTFYPSTGSCSIITSKDAAPYIWDNGYMKIGAIPVKSDVAFGPGELCPLPGSDNQIWKLGKDEEHRFKVSCRNQFHVDVNARRQLGPVRNIDECAERCGNDDSCHAFHYFQPTFPGGRADGARNCELITRKVQDGDWVPIHRPNQYLSGLKVKKSDCGDQGWNRDERGDGHKHRHHRDEDDDDNDDDGDVHIPGDGNEDEEDGHCRRRNRNGRCVERGRGHHRNHRNGRHGHPDDLLDL